MKAAIFCPSSLSKRVAWCALLLGNVSVALGAQQLVPPRVAVAKFNLGEQAKQVAKQSFGIQGDYGKDLKDELVTQLGQKIHLVERQDLEDVEREKLISNTEGFDPATAARFGKSAGARLVLLGSVTSLSGGVHPTMTKSLCGMIVKVACPEQVKGDVAITVSVRVVNVETGAVETTATGDGKASETKTLPAGSKSVDYGNHLLEVASKQALDSVVRQLGESPALAPVPATAPPPPPPAVRASYSGEILDVTGDQIIFEAGSKQGVQVGDVVQVTHPGRVIRNSKGEVVKTLVDTLGTAKVTETDDKTATATFTASGTVKPKNKDTATFKPAN